MKKGRKNYSNKSQTTIFIVLAVMIVVVLLAVFLASRTASKTELQSIFSKLEIKTESAQVQSALLDCLETTSRDALTIIGIQGGYYNPPEKYFDLGWAFIPYYYDEGAYLMPSPQTIEKELAAYTDDNLRYCIEELSYDDFTVVYGTSKTTATIEEAKVSFVTDITFNFKKSDLSSEFELKNHPVSIESSLADILEVASYITESHKENPKMICISCVTDMASEKNLYVDMLDFNQETDSLIVISENYTSSEPYVFEFLNKYPSA